MRRPCVRRNTQKVARGDSGCRWHRLRSPAIPARHVRSNSRHNSSSDARQTPSWSRGATAVPQGSGRYRRFRGCRRVPAATGSRHGYGPTLRCHCCGPASIASHESRSARGRSGRRDRALTLRRSATRRSCTTTGTVAAAGRCRGVPGPSPPTARWRPANATSA